MKAVVFVIAALMAGGRSSVVWAYEQFETHRPFLYLSLPLAAVASSSQPMAEVGFALRSSRGLASTHSGSSRDLRLVNLAFTSEGLRNWSAFGIDMKKRRAAGDSSAGAGESSTLSAAVIAGGVLVAVGLMALSQAVGKEAAKSAGDGAAPSFAPRSDISVSTTPPPPALSVWTLRR